MRRRDFLTGAAASSLLLPSAAEAMLGSRRVVLLGGATGSPAPTQFTNGAWTWFQEPRSIHANGSTFYGTVRSDNQTAAGRAQIFQINETTGAVSSYDLINGVLWSDDHNNPTFAIRPDGRLIVFYCAHAVIGQDCHFRISVNPYDISAWSQEYSIGLSSGVAGPTYPSPVILSGESNKLYLFYRNGGKNLGLITSADIATVSPATVDNGPLGATPTWSGETTVCNSSGQGIYHKVWTDGVSRIDLAMTDAVSGSAGPKNDIRHTYWQGGAFFTTNGATNLGSSGIAFSSFTAVVTSGAPNNFGDVWIWDCCRDATTGYIQVVFARFFSTSNHVYYYGLWAGASWSVNVISSGATGATPDTTSSDITALSGSPQGYYSPGVCLDGLQDGVVYACVGGAVSCAYYRYKTSNQGVTWTRQKISNLPLQQIRPVVPRNRVVQYAALFLQGTYLNYDWLTNPAPTGYNVNVYSVPYLGSVTKPVNTVAPSISGTIGVGNTLTVSTGTWTGASSFSYQWYSAGIAIIGATATTYLVTPADAGNVVTCMVIATNPGGSTGASASAGSYPNPNLVIYSNVFTNTTGWPTLSGAALGQGAATSPDGTINAWSFTENSATSQHGLTSALINFTSGQPYTLDIYAKYSSHQWVQLLLGSSAFGLNVYANFDIQNGVVGTTGAATTASISSAADAFYNPSLYGFYRLRITGTATATTSSAFVFLHSNSSSGLRGVSYTGNGTDKSFWFGAQVVSGANEVIYVPRTT